MHNPTKLSLLHTSHTKSFKVQDKDKLNHCASG